VEKPRTVDSRAIASGLVLMLVGYVRKVVVADNVAPLVDEVFRNPAGHDSLGVLAGVLLFGVQIYCDFAGYTDIARGTARLFGFELMENFRRPYFATDITTFWRRWHISLSTWLRDYLYIPLGGNRDGRARTYRNLFLTMLLGGLWHGANWTFVAWGALHGAALAVHKAFRERFGDGSGFVRRAASWLLTYAFVHLCWVFFRARDFGEAAAVLGRIADFERTTSFLRLAPLAAAVLVVLLLDLPHERADDPTSWRRLPWPVRGLVYAVALLLIVFAWRPDASPFIYFQF
jgi:alginate O-acetyltransferase complex protein AlgI